MNSFDSDLTNDQLKQLRDLLAESLRLEASIDEAEAQVKRLKNRKWKLDSDSIPEMMQALEITRMDFAGKQVTVDFEYHARIPKHLQQEAFDWLEANGHGGIIKTFEERKVHHRTLQAWSREQFEAGTAGEVPDHLFNLFAGRKARIK